LNSTLELTKADHVIAIGVKTVEGRLERQLFKLEGILYLLQDHLGFLDREVGLLGEGRDLVRE